jgi:ribonuclease Y
LNPFKFLAGLAGVGRLKAAKEEAQVTIAEAEEQKRQMLLEAREEALKTRSAVDAELKERRRELQRQERRHSQREESLDRKGESLEKAESDLAGREQLLRKKLR